MKLESSNHGFDAVLPDNSTPFQIKTSPKMFEILSSGIYTDKILAVIRELSCNAYDAHVSAGKQHVPFKIGMPTRLDPTFYVEDEGTGIDPDRIREIYWTYGESSKTNDNTQIGALGLGSKSPFAYTKSSFIVKNRYRGVEHVYLCFINKDGIPDGSKLDEQPTTKPNGVTVEFAVRYEDVQAFHDRTDKFFKYWTAVRPIFVDRKTEDILKSKVEKIIEGDGWYLEKNDFAYGSIRRAIIVQGNVPYPIDVSAFPKLPGELSHIVNGKFVITVQMGEVNFTASRENLEYDERTCENVIKRLRQVRAEIEASFKKLVFKQGMTQIEFMQNLVKTFTEFCQSFSIDKYGSDDMLKVLGTGSTVEYDGTRYNTKDLFDNNLKFSVPTYQSFGLYAFDVTRRKSGVFKKLSTLNALYVGDDPDFARATLSFDWNSRGAVLRSKRNSTEITIEYVVKHEANFKVSTSNQIVIPRTGEFTFYVNDVGGTGESRYKAARNYSNVSSAIFVNFDHKTSTLEEVLTELKSFISSGLKGAKIKLVSSMPDYRPKSEVNKPQAGSMKLTTKTYVLSASKKKLTMFGMVMVSYYHAIDKTIIDDEIFSLKEFQQLDDVYFIVKHHSKLYDEVDGQLQSSRFITYNDAELIINYVVNDLVENSKFKVFLLSKTQVEHLRKKKVNLVSFYELARDRLNEVEKTENITDRTQRFFELNRLSEMLFVDNQHLVDQLDDQSLLKQLNVEYNSTLKSANFADDCVKAQLINSLGIKFNQQHLADEFNKRYPLLKHVYRHDPGAKAAMIDYVKLVDTSHKI